MESIYYLNGRLLTAQEAKIELNDLGFARGYGVFDYLRTYQGRPFHLHDHLLRLKSSLEQVHLPLPCSLEEMEQIIHQLLEQSSLSEASIKIIVTGGVTHDLFASAEKPTFCIQVSPLISFPPVLYQHGMKLITTELARPFPTVKTTFYMPAIVALKKAPEKKAADVAFLSPNKELLETSTSNLFAIRGRVLITPDTGILRGITRQVVLKLASPFYAIELRPIPYDEIPSLDEIFTTSSTREIMPVAQIDDFLIQGTPGPVTHHLRDLFRSYTLSN